MSKVKIEPKHNFSSAELFYNSTLLQVKTLGGKGKENTAMTLGTLYCRYILSPKRVG